MSKSMRTVVVILIIAVAIAAMAWLIVRWNQASRRSLVVANAGPLDIRLWGIRPNAGDIIYDPNGKEVRRTLGFGREDRRWKENSRRFDFIFELPETDEVPLFTTFPRLKVSGEDRRLGGGFARWVLDCGGKRLLCLRTTFDRTFRRPIFRGLWVSECDVDSLDIALDYHYGSPGRSLFTLKGPFVLDSKISSPDGVYDVSFTRDSAGRSEAYIEFEWSTSKGAGIGGSVVAYDESGGRHLAEVSSQQGRRIRYRIRGMSLNKIFSIAF
ncbi:MAG: hypothetical protein ACYS8Z_16860, partial [Planctomycetota bacterium]